MDDRSLRVALRTLFGLGIAWTAAGIVLYSAPDDFSNDNVLILALVGGVAIAFGALGWNDGR